MSILLLTLMLVLNFSISWMNAKYVGMYWTESRLVGGIFRFYIVTGYIMAIAGFTMVYGYILLLLAPIVLQLANVDTDTILMFEQLAADLIYLFTVLTIIPTGFYIWIRSLKNFWEERSMSSGITAVWNTYAEVHNLVNVARNAPSALERVVETLFGGKGKKKDETIIIMLAILVVIFAIFGGYFTASAIMKKADSEYDMFSDIHERHPEAFQ